MTTYPIKCRIRAEGGGVTRVDVYDDIGAGGWFSDGVSASDFAAQLAAIKGALEVHINSGGGDVFDGITIGNSIRAHKGPVTTVVDGLAASIASVIAMAGQDRVMTPGSMLMIHDAFGACMGNAEEMAQMAGTLDKVSGNIAAIYADRCGGTEASWRAAMKAETWYTADEAVAAGLADKVAGDQAELPAGLDLAAFTTVPGRIAARLRTMPKAAASGDGDGGAGDSAAACQTCGGSGRQRHPQTGKFTQACAGCGGTGQAPAADDGTDTQDAADEPDDGTVECPLCHGTGKILEGHRKCPDCDGTGRVPAGSQDRAGARVVAVTTRGRVLGIETMPVADLALPVHHTATVNDPWDGPAAVAAMPDDDTVLKYCHAWEDEAAASVPHREGDDDADDQKQNYKFPHHKTTGGPAYLAACRNGLARLSSADIPAGDDAGVQAHLQAHLDDASGGSSNHVHLHPDVSGADLEKIRAALRGATE